MKTFWRENTPSRANLGVALVATSVMLLSPSIAFASTAVPKVVFADEAELKMDSQTLDNYKAQLVVLRAELRRAKGKSKIADAKAALDAHAKLYQIALNKLGTDLQNLLAQANKYHVTLSAAYIKSLSKNS